MKTKKRINQHGVELEDKYRVILLRQGCWDSVWYPIEVG
ncbi:hypothetical protein Ga0451573_003718 [Peptococcaceae bacterium DYL19]|nr:hypothetical protein [Phosphitispora fastidiosa]